MRWIKKKKKKTEGERRRADCGQEPAACVTCWEKEKEKKKEKKNQNSVNDT